MAWTRSLAEPCDAIVENLARLAPELELERARWDELPRLSVEPYTAIVDNLLALFEDENASLEKSCLVCEEIRGRETLCRSPVMGVRSQPWITGILIWVVVARLGLEGGIGSLLSSVRRVPPPRAPVTVTWYWALVSDLERRARVYT